MGIAAYNRGSAVISRQITAELPSLNDQLLADLNARPKGEARLYQGTVIRLDGQGGFWLMNRPEGGWASYGRVYRSLWQIADYYALHFVGVGRDEHSVYIQVEAL